MTARTARTARRTPSAAGPPAGDVPRPAAGALAADGVLPHRDALLDPDAAALRLHALLGPLLGPDAPRGPVTTHRVRYQPGRSLRVAQVLGGGAPGLPGPAGLVVSTRGVAPERWERVADAAGARATRDGPPGRSTSWSGPGRWSGAVVADAATSSVSWVFPRDRRLATLPEVWARSGPVRRVVGERWAATRLMALSPEKAATLRCLDDDGGTLAYAKVHAEAAAARDAAGRADLATLAGRPGDHLAPAVLAVVPQACTVVLAPVPGRSLADLGPDELADALAGLGTTLARLHGLPAGTLPPLTRYDAPSLAAAAQAVAAGRPDLAAAAADLAARLAATDPRGPADAAVPVHGDPSPSNALLTATGVVLVDFDEAAAGHPAADLAGVLAGLRRGCLLGAVDAAHADGLAARFTGAYGALAGPPDPAALRWHVAAAMLVQGAARAVRRVQPAALARCAALLDDGLALAAGRLDLAHAPTGEPGRTP